MTGADVADSRLLARLFCRGADIESAELTVERPERALRALHQRPAPECPRLLQMLFPRGGYAHSLAACEAIECVLGADAGPAQRAARTTIVLADAVASHTCRAALDWPELMEHPIDADCVTRGKQLVERIVTCLYPQGDWSALGGGHLAPDPHRLKSARAMLHQLRDQMELERKLAAVRARLSRAMIGADPMWPAQLQPCFADMAAAATSSVAVLDARLQALASLPPARTTITDGGTLATASGRGTGHAHTARGSLTCEVAIESGRMVDCTISASADHAFAPEGTAARLLKRLRRAANPAAAARWILAAFDPGATVHVEVVHCGRE